jgi:chromosomal replication initiation ATPase DnaA
MKAVNSEATRVQIAVYKPVIDVIQKTVAEYYGLSEKECREHTRKGSSIQARKRICYLARTIVPKCPLAIIGLLIGNGQAFDHAGVYHAARSLEKEMLLKNSKKELIYPQVLEEITLLRDRITVGLKVPKHQSIRPKNTVNRCPHCGKFIAS